MSRDEPSHSGTAPALPEPLRSHLEQIADTLAQFASFTSRATPAEISHILAEHRGTFYRAMDALGVGIVDFLAADPPPDQAHVVCEQIAAQIREWSGTSPLLRHSLRKPRGQAVDPVLVKALLEKRPAGADIPALVFNDYYMYSIGGLAYRDRVRMLVQAVQQAVSGRAAAGANPVRVLSLHVSGAGEILLLAQDETFAEIAEVICIDNRPSALRAIRRDLKGRFEKRCSFVRVDALNYANWLDQSPQPHDIIYGVGIWEHLDTDQAIRLAQDCRTLLAPGGVLLAGSVTKDIPASEQILRAWLTGSEIEYRDEAAWRSIFAQSGFAATALRFEYERLKANVLISAEKDGTGA